jgi:hypothetical protein
MTGALTIRIKRPLHLQRPDVTPVRKDSLRAARAEPEFESRYPACIGATRQRNRYSVQLNEHNHRLPADTRDAEPANNTPGDNPQAETDAYRDQKQDVTLRHERMNHTGQHVAAITLMAGMRQHQRREAQQTKQG